MQTLAEQVDTLDGEVFKASAIRPFSTVNKTLGPMALDKQIEHLSPAHRPIWLFN